MTPAINAVKKQKIPHSVHQYEHDPSHSSYGEEAAEKMGVSASQVFKTLVLSLDNQSLVVAIIPVSAMLSMKQVAKVFSVKKALMADVADVERSTGYVLGGVSPLGQKKRLKTVLDESAKAYDTIYVSAGRRGLELSLSPNDLCQLLNARYETIAQAAS